MRSLPLACCFVLIGVSTLVGCSQEFDSANWGPASEKSGSAVAMDSTKLPDGYTDVVTESGEEAPADVPLERKIVYTASVELVVEDFDALETDLQKLLKANGGRITSSNTRVAHRDRREGTWVIRVPVKNFETFLAAAKKLGELRDSGIDSQDRTAEYYDVDAALNNKRKTLERFKKIAEDHSADLKHVREVEKDIERVQGEIDRLSGRIRLMNDLVAMTTVTLTAYEIRDYVPEESATFGTEISRSFTGSIDSLLFTGRQFCVFLVAAAPWLVILVVALLVLRLLIRFAWRRFRARSAAAE